MAKTADKLIALPGGTSIEASPMCPEDRRYIEVVPPS